MWFGLGRPGEPCELILGQLLQLTLTWGRAVWLCPPTAIKAILQPAALCSLANLIRWETLISV